MKIVWLWANPNEGVACRPRRAMLLIFKRNALHTHGVHTGEQKCRAEQLPIDLSIYLVGRFLDFQVLKHCRKLSVTDAAIRHLGIYLFPRYLLPLPVSLAFRGRRAPRFFLHYSWVFWRPLFVFCHQFIFGRIRPAHIRHNYTSSADYFCEEKLLTKTLSPSPVRQNGVIFLATTHAGIQLPSHGGAR